MQEGLTWIVKWVKSIWDLPAPGTNKIFPNIRNLSPGNAWGGVFLLPFLNKKKQLQIPSQTSRKTADVSCIRQVGKFFPWETPKPHIFQHTLCHGQESCLPQGLISSHLNFELGQPLSYMGNPGDSWAVLAKFPVVHKSGAVRNKASLGLWGVSNLSQAKAEWDQRK